MTSNYYTFAAIVRELAEAFRDACFEEAYSHRPNELRLRFDRGTIVAVLHPVSGALFYSTQPEKRPRTNVQLFFPRLASAKLEDIAISPNDRVVNLRFGDKELRLSFFGHANADLVMSGENLESFRKLTDAAAPSKSGAKFGKRYTREMEARGIPEAQMEAGLLSATSATVYERDDNVLLSLMPLRDLESGWESRRFESVNDAVRYVIVERAKRQRFGAIKRELLSATEREIDQLTRAQSEMRKGAEDSNRPERYVAIANALLMHAHEIERGLDEVVLPIEETPTTIKLDPEISVHENATQYFDRAKRSRQSREELKVRAVSIASELARLEARRAQIVQAESLDTLLELKSPRKEKGIAAPPSKFREYTVAGGMTVLVGRNAKQNDDLTLHTAKKDDIWLHARGVPGSHVVLQVTGRKQIPKEAIVQAAEIAAYHSDAKTQSLAPVSYTPKKYVRKPKGADAGAVIVEREEVVMVTPRVPAP